MRQFLLFYFLIIGYFECSEALRAQPDLAEAIVLSLLVFHRDLQHACAVPHELICFGMHALDVHLLYLESVGLCSVYILVEVTGELLHVYDVWARILLRLIVPCIEAISQILESDKNLVLGNREQPVCAALRREVVGFEYVECSFRWPDRVVAYNRG